MKRSHNRRLIAYFVAVFAVALLGPPGADPSGGSPVIASESVASTVAVDAGVATVGAGVFTADAGAFAIDAGVFAVDAGAFAVDAEAVAPPDTSADWAATEEADQARAAPPLADEHLQEMRLQREFLSSRGRKAVEPREVEPPRAEPRRLPDGRVVVPVLMYHHIDTPGPSADAIRRDLSVPPKEFAAQLAYLSRNGYHTIALADLIGHLKNGGPLPSDPVVLTFDDGYLDNYTSAFPLLRRYGFHGTFFVITQFLGQGEYMSWEQARQMHLAGMDMESHTLDHPDLPKISPERALRQLTESRAVLEARLGKTVRYLSYPAGRFDQEIIRFAEKAGYHGAVTTVYGDAHQATQAFDLARIRIRGSDSLEVFAQKVHGPPPASAEPVSSTTRAPVD